MLFGSNEHAKVVGSLYIAATLTRMDRFIFPVQFRPRQPRDFHGTPIRARDAKEASQMTITARERGEKNGEIKTMDRYYKKRMPVDQPIGMM